MAARTSIPFDPAVVSPWAIGEGPRGVLLLHGFAGTPPELRRLGNHLAGRGYRCRGPALAGHATTPEALLATDRRDWTRSAQAELDRLAGECEQVMVVGQSMGGTIALHLAATDLRIAAVATLAAPVWLSAAATRLISIAKYVVRWHTAGSDVDLYDPVAIEELYSHGRRPMRSIREFTRLLGEVRDELAMIRAPVLVLHGGRDRTIDPENALEIERRLVCSSHVARIVFPRSGHGMSVDIDSEPINAAVTDWLDSHTSAPLTPSAGR
ncbi:MAG: alpha/beta fold hydrolase [Candidatus Dormibacteraeota bacterium]|uniref:Alpha/beta fold hydrolase n=1 Tax=Candidatus Amunia macphersoniae TaxID=3127014 RepID=A0A934NIR4_9BACT|nr:alpha/beta fold hydrolase [Candidatus Dormibacteraeota bacterium]